ncbi:hypothetical protein PITCH_A1390005 [uncultured Desulfobacterium sp.]|uniref:Uncharacterized protein n=1 Tax=uncultured Desulfobacterium sp. TaxID=201089 RepID=A0A445MSR5_9BACT|nr:hypothetical protein PITCH_A1390005 [uncultured Desulfobacterium sp.]
MLFFTKFREISETNRLFGYHENIFSNNYFLKILKGGHNYD